jgi:signal transduction histidine kinase
MWPAPMLSSVSARLALFYALMFAASVAAFGYASLHLVDGAFRRQSDQRIVAEMQDLASLKHPGALSRAVNARMASTDAFSYRLDAGNGGRVFGNFPKSLANEGWEDVSLLGGGAEAEAPDAFRTLTVKTADGLLTVALDTDGAEDLRAALQRVFLATLLLASALAVLGGLWLGRIFSNRFNALGRTADAVAAGALNLRMPVSAGKDEFDRLSAALNRMLDQNAILLDAQRRVASDIAHDIRTPLARLRQKLEHLQDKSGGEEIGEALGEADNVLTIISALLRISELEEGSRKAGFGQVDLTLLAENVCEAFAASFEDQGKTLSLSAAGPVDVCGDRDLLAQLLANLVENALSHTQAGANAEISVRNADAGAVLAVSDNGPGIAEAELASAAKRFYRAERSRKLPGNGLGLSLADAITNLHGGRLQLRNLNPGLEAAVFLPGQVSKPLS